MIFYYVRHGDPIYNPDSLTPLGKRQAEALARRFSLCRLDEIYSSTSNRAIETATPTAEILKKEIKLLDFANEGHAWSQLTYERDGKRKWIADCPVMKRLFCTPEIYTLGFEWHQHPELRKYNFGEGMARIEKGADELFASLGFTHEPHTGMYKKTGDSPKKVALFAHAGFGIAFLSAVLDIPFPILASRGVLFTSGVTAIEFPTGEDGYAIPRIKTFNSEGHLFADRLPDHF